MASVECEFCRSGEDVETQDMLEGRVMFLCASCRANIASNYERDHAGVETGVETVEKIISVGRIVHYTLSEQDAQHINRRRVPILDSAAQLKSGAQVHIGNTAREGDIFPMIVCRIWGPVEGVSAGVNGQVFLDGNDTLWVTSRKEGEEPGQWAWPVLV